MLWCYILSNTFNYYYFLLPTHDSIGLVKCISRTYKEDWANAQQKSFWFFSPWENFKVDNETQLEFYPKKCERVNYAY